MTSKHLFSALMAVSLSMSASAQTETPQWIRRSAISPDGQNIAFCYKGDVFVVPATGGVARQITTNTAYDSDPVWSPDGKTIAFASDREGGKDVYITTPGGGTPRRITTHSGNEIPVAFLDNKTVLFRAYMTPTTSDLQFPSGSFYQIYKVPVAGGRPELFSELTMADLSIGPDGRILYNDVKGYEDYWRKHQTSSIARDVWMYDGKTYTKLTTFKGEDREPEWAPDGKSFYYLSEQDGTFNVYRRSLEPGAKDTQLTHFRNNPVRFLTVAGNGTLCYCQDGELYTQKPDGKPRKVAVTVVRDEMAREVVKNLYSNGASQVSVSPKNKEIAFIMHGDVFVTSLDYSTTKQITDTPELERTVNFAPDGRALVYAAERDGIWQIYQTSLAKDDEKNFVYATELKEERLTDGKYTAFQPAYNPKGGEIAFLKDRTELCVMDLKSRKVRTVMPGKFQYSYTDGDQDYTWSPNGKWLLSEYIGIGGWNNKDIALIAADGKTEPVNLTNSGYSEGSPKWAFDGRAVLFKSDRAGYRSHGSWGAQNDLYIMFLDTDSYERFRMNKEELALLEEKEKAEKEAKEKAEKEKKEKEEKDKKGKKDKAKDGDDKKTDDKKAEEEKPFELDNLPERTIRLTPYSTSVGDYLLTKAGDQLYYIAPHAGHGALWVQNLRDYSHTLKQQYMDWVSFNVDPAMENAYMASGGRIKKMVISSGAVSDLHFETFATSRPAETRAYLFNHMWKQTKDKLYVADMNGVKWDDIRKTYERYLPSITNGYDFAEMASEMLGELNVSHTGCRYGYNYALGTASLGVFYDTDFKGDGLKIKEIIAGGPLDKKSLNVKPGDVITHIDGEKIVAGEDYFPLLAGKAGRYTRIKVEQGGKTAELTVRPISTGSETDLLYRRWVKRNEHMVDSLSNGRLAYLHIKAMDAGSFHEMYRELLSDKNRRRDAVVVDTRHNGGGWLHGDICVLLSGKQTISYEPRGQFIGIDPFDRWVKPSCMLVCEDNYSNAHGTPWMYKELGLGKVIGAPVPGTMTAVWWEHVGDYVFGIPQVASVDNRGKYLENQQLQPDIEVYNTPVEQLTGVDRQIEAAVKHLLQATKGGK